MPVYNYFSTLEGKIIEHPQTLVQAGPLIPIEISVPTPLIEVLRKEKKPIPSPITGYALIDTGCTITSIDAKSIESLGVNAVGVVSIGTAGGASVQNKYPVHVKFPGTLIEIEYSSVFSVNLDGQNFQGTKILALVGRDILANCIFIYNGMTGMFSFAH